MSGLRAQQEQKQEPVAWIDDSGHPKHRLYRQSATEKRLYGPLRPLYAAPPRPTGLPHCERSCEANAFQIEIRRLKAALKERNA
jgi:hypothetical protein